MSAALSRSGVDIAAVAQAALSACPGLLQQWFPHGKLQGHEFCIGNLRGDPGKSLKINIRTGQWADFGDDSGQTKGGDIVSAYAALRGVSQPDAARELSAKLGLSGEPSAVVIPAPQRTKPAAEVWRPIVPKPEGAPPPPTAHPRYGKPAHITEVRNTANALLHYTYRFEPEGERKQILPLTYGELDGRIGWHWKAPPAPRPLYGVPDLAGLWDQPVLLVGGEKKRDLAATLLRNRAPVLSWPGGVYGVENADVEALRDLHIRIWPDADDNGGGLHAATRMAERLQGIAASVAIAPIPEGKGGGWDVADAIEEGWTAEQVLEQMAGAVEALSFRKGGPEKAAAPKHETVRNADDDTDPYGSKEHFLTLGHDRSMFYFLPASGGQVVELKARDLSSAACLMQLAPLQWWECNFPSNKGGFRVAAAADFLMRSCERVGIYDRARLRGRGAWFDSGRTVLHLGDRLIVDGKATGLEALGDGYIYERARRFNIPLGVPLDDMSAARLLDLCCAIHWKDPRRSGTLFAGWLAVAPVCGALPWRPHAWISGEAGSGKTWLIDHLVKPALGPMAVLAQGKSTEAGLRGELGRDARPVCFDEAETQNQTDHRRMQMVLDLARQASSEDGADVLKGTESGGVRRNSIRSCFIFSSINQGLSQAADESRTVPLPLDLPPTDGDERAKHFARINALHAEVMAPDFQARLLARTLRLLPTIRKNTATFAAAIARSGHSQRTGDTHGVLLAGAWSLRSSREVTAEEAKKWVAEHAWLRASLASAEVTPDWRRALDFLAQQTLRINNIHGRAEDLTVAELLNAARGLDEETILPENASTALGRIGLRWPSEKHVAKGELAANTVLLSRTSERVKRWFENTPWAAAWVATLERAPGAMTIQKGSFKFAAQAARAVAIPAPVFFGEDGNGESE